MSLFGKPKTVNYDTAGETAAARRQAEIQRGLLGANLQDRAKMSTQYQTDRSKLASQIEPAAEQRLQRYGQDLEGVSGFERSAREAANIGQREQAFREVPELQRAVRASLGGSGLMGSGAARAQIANPLLQAATESRDFANKNTIAQLASEAGRKENFAQTGFSERGRAAEQRFGLEEGTIDKLMSIGREDLVAKLTGESGIESDLYGNEKAIRDMDFASRSAAAAAKNAKRGAVIGALGQLGGAATGAILAGVTGGASIPLSAALGGQLGGSAANIATGSPTQFDPSLLFALQQQQNSKKVSPYTYGAPVGPYAPGARV
jgi:hypothetical protein